MVTAINEELAILRASCLRARELASAAGCLGLDRMYGELERHCDVVDGVSSRIKNVVHRNVDEAFQNANAASENVLRAALAGAEMAKKDQSGG